MKLRRLSLVNFKNIASASPEFSAGLNCFVGDNGAGKTNVLDAVHYLSMCRSSLGTTDRQSVRHGADFFVVEGHYSSDDGHGTDVVCSFSTGYGSGSDSGSVSGSGSRGCKKIKCGGKEYERFSDHVGLVPMVMVSPADAFLISDAADERRRWLNAFISGLDRAYLSALVRYNAVLAERNKLLRDISGSGFNAGASEILDVLDLQLAAHGGVIHVRRAEILEQIKPLVADYYARLSDDSETVELSYRSELNDRPFEEALASAREKDAAGGFTTAGVHRDDIVMRIGGHPLRRYGSQGQQKSFLVALKLAQFVLIHRTTGETPILLLDDLFDKLDTGRVERLMGLIGSAGQIFISDCNRARLEDVLRRGGMDYSLFEVVGGEITGIAVEP